MTDFPTGEGETGGVQQVFLLQSETGGGFILTADTLRQLPPWPEGVSELLGSVSSLVYALPAFQSAGLAIEAHAFLERVLAEIGEQLESFTGRLERGSQIIFLGAPGSFACGSVPWTKPQPLSASRLAPPPLISPFHLAPPCAEPAYDDPWEQASGWERAR